MGKSTKKVAGAARKIARKTGETDQRVTHTVAAVRETRPARIVALLMECADQPELITASLGTIGAGVVAKRPDLVRGGARMLASHLVATGMKMLVKQQVDRTRPKKALAEGEHRFEAGHSHDHEMNSLPSGHTAGAVAVARAASHEIDGVAVPATIATGAVAAAQVPTGSHYLTDVIAGGMIGWAAEAVVGAVFDRFEAKQEERVDGKRSVPSQKTIG
ncbi:phosphatase PAP2 family protein [Sphingomonas aerophila]|uniref:Undecaprenyl-diphosphatase n=1 Tax=Sphingomonas aerophila TaxID=1344948 RepID=A0A7W9BC49_9SPHN|nr:phosphatase PAP2 family protein [Sphingomonas aerophila]MBB5714468.1 undecaprenyl-diphosphatase [Sphingomonas aerophila]